LALSDKLAAESNTAKH